MARLSAIFNRPNLTPPAPPKIHYSMLVLGIVAAGGIFTATNPAYTAREMSHHIKASDAVFVITEPELLPTVLEVKNEPGSAIKDIWIFHPLKDQKVPPGQKSWTDLLNKGERDWVRFDDERLSREITAFRLFSSGTTGLPKAVEITHRNLVAQFVAVNEYKSRPYEVRFSTTTSMVSLKSHPK